MHEVCGGIFVPEWARIFKAGLPNQRQRFRPGTIDRLRGHDKNTFGWSREVDVEQPIVLANGWSPHAHTITIAPDKVITSIDIKPRQCMAKNLPMHKVERFQNRNAGNKMKARGNHVEMITITNDVRIGVVRE